MCLLYINNTIKLFVKIVAKKKKILYQIAMKKDASPARERFFI